MSRHCPPPYHHYDDVHGYDDDDVVDGAYLINRLVKGVGEMTEDGEDDGACQQRRERVGKTEDICW